MIVQNTYCRAKYVLPTKVPIVRVAPSRGPRSPASAEAKVVAQLPERNSLSVRRTLAIAIVVAALVGAAAGYTAGYLSRARQPPQAREFWVFTTVLPFNDTAVGVSHDYFAPDRILVFKGDTVTIHFYNTEDEPEAHTFTMDAPYTVNKNLAMNERVDITFAASVAGVFAYRCTYHQPSMTGWLVVMEN